MTGEPHVPTGLRVPLAGQTPVTGGVPFPQEPTVPPTVPPSEAAPPVERTGPWAPVGSGQPDAPAPPLIAGRYELGPEIAHGGMGAVYRATDRVFGREVAVKLVREDLVGTSPAVRFAEEARITARLQHPGVPPVHDLGQLPDGRPFLAMKLFRGRDLAAELADRAAQLAACDAPDDPSEQVLDRKELSALHEARRQARAEELRRLTRIFEQVCQAVAYAHSQRVVHRDLKPANVMVAAFGEIQVMDWGLAKRLPEPVTAAAAQGAVPPGPGAVPPDGGPCGEAERTRPGAVMGTLAYMPPEQARGETEAVDARADVFALGAILCQILTGRPPYPGRTAQEVWQQAAAGDLTAALDRLKQHASAPDDLEARLAGVALRCLAPAPPGRPAHAGEVAAAVTGALTRAAESHRQAELSQARTDAEMGYGKRGRLAPGLKALGLLLLLAIVWLFGYAYRAATVAEASWTAEKEQQLRWLQQSVEEANKERQLRRGAEGQERERLREGKKNR
jgi:hypothetical protein